MDHATADKGGDIGWVAPYEKDQQLETAIFALTKVGQISPPVKATDGSLYIYKLLDTSDERYVDADRLSSLKSAGYPRWRDKLKADLGFWIDPQFESTAATGS